MKNRSLTATLGLVAAGAILVGPACATKKMVVREIANVDQKIEGVEASVEENQQRLKDHDQRLASIGSLIAQHDTQFKTVDGKIEEVRKVAQGTLLFKETIRDNNAHFKFDSAELSPEAKTSLDGLVSKLIAEDRGVWLEIQGHTDKTGPEDFNMLLGEKRAKAVEDYLYRQHHIPLHRMETVSYGFSSPVADNSTREGRAQNRRVEVLVYE